MIEYDVQYRHVLNRILKEGYDEKDRTGVGVRKVFDVNINVDLSSGGFKQSILPILGLRKSYPRPFWMELFWMLSGSTDASVLKKKNIHIWDLHSSKEFQQSRGLGDLPEGSIGDGYGKQFRNFGGVDQLMEVMIGLIENPNSRRHYISLWNPVDSDRMCLLPCHTTYNFCVTGEHLNLKFFQRSSDWLVAGNANFMFSAFFLTWVAKKLGFKVGNLSHSITDCHIYSNHMEAARTIANREPIDSLAFFTLPESGIDLSSTENLKKNLNDEIEWMLMDFTWDSVKSSIHGYECHPPIPKDLLSMAV